MLQKTKEQYDDVVNTCKSLFAMKIADYGASWHLFRLPSITDQIYIKLKRIRSIQEKKKQLIEDSIEGEYIGIINYCIIAHILILQSENLIQIDFTHSSISWDELESIYDEVVKNTQELVIKKNHDYDEAWRDLRISSMVDLMLVKIHRIKQIEENDNVTQVSEGIKSQYQDIMNYAIFCLIRIHE